MPKMVRKDAAQRKQFVRDYELGYAKVGGKLVRLVDSGIFREGLKREYFKLKSRGL